MLRLRDTGVHNIDLVTPSHYTRVIVQALDGLELGIPVVWNSSGYESVETLRMLEGLVQVYLPDLKYLNADTARRFSAAPDYPQVAVLALKEMFRQRGPYRMNEDSLLISGLLVRHLILPGHAEESMDIIDFIADTFPRGSVLFSLMSQYTPMSVFSSAPELCRAVTEEENRNLLHYLSVRRVTAGYWQDTTSSGTAEIPAFDGTGLDF
jgi:putative pyruvate formate lyase activating enzyme